MVVYYEGRGAGNTTNNITAFPPGFQMLSGNSGARAYDPNTLTYAPPASLGGGGGRPISDRVSFACLDSSGPLKEQPFLNITSCDDGLRAQIQFQSCWDGIHLYKPDQSHVAYLSDIDNGYCPPDHPVLMMHLFFEVLYSVVNINTTDGGMYVFSNGDATGFGFHGDFINGWDNATQVAAIEQCANTADGSIQACPPLAASDDPYFNINCPEQPPIFNETVQGLLKAIPGCNPVTAGNGTAPQNICPIQPVLNYVNNSANYTRIIPTPGLEINDFTYLGCANDTGAVRSLTGSMYTSTTSMTIEACTSFCASAGYLLAGLEYSSQCYCGAFTDPNQPILTTATCGDQAFMVCSGNGLEFCGAPNLLQVWNNTQYTGQIITGPPVPGVTILQLPSTGSADYLGCYTDTGNPRTLNASVSNIIPIMSSNPMTLEYCASLCQKNGKFQYFGTEYNYQVGL